MRVAGRIALGLVGLALLVTAAVLALVAEDARRWPDRVRQGDVQAMTSAAASRDVAREREAAFSLLRRGARRPREERAASAPLPDLNPW